MPKGSFYRVKLGVYRTKPNNTKPHLTAEKVVLEREFQTETFAGVLSAITETLLRHQRHLEDTLNANRERNANRA